MHILNRTLSTTLAAICASLCLAGNAAAQDKAPGTPGLSEEQAKDLKTQSEAEYKARKKVADANKTLNQADCKEALEGSPKRACNKSARAAAKSDKADAKLLHEMEEKAIKDAKK